MKTFTLLACAALLAAAAYAAGNDSAQTQPTACPMCPERLLCNCTASLELLSGNSWPTQPHIVWSAFLGQPQHKKRLQQPWVTLMYLQTLSFAPSAPWEPFPLADLPTSALSLFSTKEDWLRSIDHGLRRQPSFHVRLSYAEVVEYVPATAGAPFQPGVDNITSTLQLTCGNAGDNTYRPMLHYETPATNGSIIFTALAENWDGTVQLQHRWSTADFVGALQLMAGALQGSVTLHLRDFSSAVPLALKVWLIYRSDGLPQLQSGDYLRTSGNGSVAFLSWRTDELQSSVLGVAIDDGCKQQPSFPLHSSDRACAVWLSFRQPHFRAADDGQGLTMALNFTLGHAHTPPKPPKPTPPKPTPTPTPKPKTPIDADLRKLLESGGWYFLAALAGCVVAAAVVMRMRRRAAQRKAAGTEAEERFLRTHDVMPPGDLISTIG